MSKKLFKSMAGVVLSATMMISAVATAFASRERCDYCGSDNLSEIGRTVIDCWYFNPNEHAVGCEVEYFCLDCVDCFYDRETEYEIHTYDLDETTGILTCEGCGDSYEW